MVVSSQETGVSRISGKGADEGVGELGKGGKAAGPRGHFSQGKRATMGGRGRKLNLWEWCGGEGILEKKWRITQLCCRGN